MIPLREDEPHYAKLALVGETAALARANAEKLNRYGNPIELLPDGDHGVSLNINGDAGIGDNPNRTRQHAFHFTADNCIGCHACEAACSEKNDLPPHLSFRSVGYVEGGTYPDYARINISMACNHCDDPVCLKGCPTRAYTKHPEYGAVIQDPDICFRLRLLHLGMPLQRAAARSDGGAGREVQHVRRSAGSGTEARLRLCLRRQRPRLRCGGGHPRPAGADRNPHSRFPGPLDHQSQHPFPAGTQDTARSDATGLGAGEVPQGKRRRDLPAGG